MSPDRQKDSRAGWAYALSAYGMWGLLPLFWKQLGHVPALELLLHRVAWAFVFLLALIVILRRTADLREVLRSGRLLGTLSLSALLVAVNWFIFVYAIVTDRVLYVSLGYFINPLVSVALGVILLGERMRPIGWVALALAAAGVVQMGVTLGELPWLSLLLAFSFGFYGLIRKRVSVGALPGTAIEAMILSVPAIAGIVWLESRGDGHFVSGGSKTTLLLLTTGVITALPLWWFAGAARRLPLTVIGFLQYLAPSLHFLLAVFWFDEPFTQTHVITFACIWAGVALFALDGWLRSRARPAKSDPR